MSGQITILPGHDNLISVLKPGIIKIVPSESQSDRKFSFLIDKEFVAFGVLGWVCKIEWNEVQILTNMVLLDNVNPIELLQEMKQTLLQKVHNWSWSDNWSIESNYDLELQIQKIDVEMKLAMRKRKD